jgi:thioredoxin reductase (NADPH)
MTENYDVVVVGGGGAGLTAALYTARAQLKTALFEKNISGGQISITDIVENYPGFPEGITGPEIADLMESQARKSGAELFFEAVLNIEQKKDFFSVRAEQKVVNARAVIFAMGAQPRMLDVPSEKGFIGKGVSYCAVCDAPFFRNKVVAVIGGGDSAIQEALYLTKFATKVYVVHRRDQLRASAVLQERAGQNEKIEFVWDSVVNDINGKVFVEELVVKNVKTGALNKIPLNGVFVFIGHEPSSLIAKPIVECDDSGYVLTDLQYATSLDGIYACGEIRSGATWQLVAACGEGCSAALNVEKYLENQR